MIRRILAAHKERTLAETDLRVVFDFEYLGVALVEKPSVDSRSRALENPNIALVSPPPVFETLLSATDSANQLNAGALEALGISGQGASVLVTDSGLASGFNNHSDFGFCTAPGVPSFCQMASYHVLDATGDNPHGTNVAGIVARTARSAKIHFYDVGCTGICINGAMAMLALNEATQNAATLNIVVHNMSWGSAPPANCSAYDGWFAPAVAVGMIQVAASGNDFSLNAIGAPACSNYVVSVGNADSRPAGSSPSDWVANSSSNVYPGLDFVAPGTSIDAGGYNDYTGTSMASPHVAGAFAVMRSTNAWANSAPSRMETYMKATGSVFIDQRVGLSFPVPDLIRVRPRELVIVNPDYVPFNVQPSNWVNCGPQCFLFPETAVTIFFPNGYTVPGCARNSPNSCILSLTENRSVRLMRTERLTRLLASRIEQGMHSRNLLFADGFE